jgi:hypothetical protein
MLALWVAWDGVEEKWMPIFWCSWRRQAPCHAGTAPRCARQSISSASLCLTILTILTASAAAGFARNVDLDHASD